MDLLIPGIPTILTTGYTVIYTVPSDTKAVISFLRIANVSAGAVTVSMSVVPSAGSPSASNSIMFAFSVAANDFIDMSKGMMLSTGSTVQALASAGSSITVKLDVIENSP